MVDLDKAISETAYILGDDCTMEQIWRRAEGGDEMKKKL